VKKESRRLLFFLLKELGDNLVDHLIGQGADFILRLWLNRVLDENGLVLWHAERRALRMGGANELGGCDVRGGNALLFEVDYIVRTARNAGPSIAKGLDDGVTLLRQFSLDRCRRRTRHCRLHAAENFFHAVFVA
jgi:hypothetical protein